MELGRIGLSKIGGNMTRFSSQEAEKFGFKLLNAMRNQFGGHESQRKVKPFEREGA